MLKLILPLVLFLFWANTSFAADITFDAVSDSTLTAPIGSTVTFSATLGASADFLSVCANARDVLNVTGVTWNGVAMTLDKELLSADVLYSSLWSLPAPATGTHNVVITFSAAPTYGSGTAISLIGVKQTSYVDVSASAQTTGANASLPITTTVDKTAVVDCISLNDTTLSMSAVTSRVERSNFLALANGRKVGSSTVITQSVGLVTLAWTNASSNSSDVAVAYKPVATVSTAKRGMLLGILP